MSNNKKLFYQERYTWEWERKALPYYLYLFLTQWRYCQLSPPVFGYIIYKKGNANCYLVSKTLENAAKDILNKVQKDSFLKKWSNFVFKTSKDLHQFCNRLSKTPFKKLSQKQLIKLYQESCQRYLNHTDGVAVIRNTNRLLEAKLIQIFKDPKIVSQLLASEKKSVFIKEEEDLLKIASRIEKQKISKIKLDDLLKKHCQQFFYINYGYFAGAKILQKSGFENKLKTFVQQQHTLKSLQNKLRQQERQKRNLIKKLRPPRKILNLIKFGSTGTYFKDFIRANLNRLHYFNTFIFQEIARRTKNKWQDVANLVPKEAEKILKNKKKIKSRDFAVLYSNQKGIFITFGKEAKRIERMILKKITSAISTQLKGTVASPGRVSGRVLILYTIKDLGRNNNFILVTPMTTPDLVPVIRKAKAIVTDEGGLTSHAAIVSRELGIPCIVGTKFATKVLKNGNLVEVDANLGVVQKLK